MKVYVIMHTETPIAAPARRRILGVSTSNDFDAIEAAIRKGDTDECRLYKLYNEGGQMVLGEDDDGNWIEVPGVVTTVEVEADIA